jgi:hypothetical protein
MERGEQKPSDAPSQAVEEGRSCILEQRRVITAVTQMLDSGMLDERSSRLLEQLADCIQCSPMEAAQEPQADSEAAPQPAPPREGSPEAESTKEPGKKPGPCDFSKEPAEKRIV